MEWVAIILYCLGALVSWAFLESEHIRDCKWWAKTYLCVLWPLLAAGFGAATLALFISDAWGVWRYSREQQDG